jgi:flagellar biosynthesis protein FlhF
MTMKRYQARDMRSALRQIREELGPNAVILSTKPVIGGVEVSAAGELEQGLIRDWKMRHSIGEPVEVAATPAAPQASATPAVVAVTAPVVTPAIAAATLPDAQQHNTMNDELRSLRRLLEQQLTALAANDFTRREPQRARIQGELLQLGLSPELVRTLLLELPAESSTELTATVHHELLICHLHTAALPTEAGGVVALIGPPGAGKSTMLAKLAVREVLRHGANSLALVSTDTNRLGASEQIRSLGRLLGVATHVVADAQELRLAATALAGKRLVLIDTTGVPVGSNESVTELGQLLAALPGVRSLLVLPASAQGAVLSDCLAGLRPLTLHSAVLTRLDEARSLGGALGALISAALPVSGISDGARIPEDFKPARASELVARAFALLPQAGDSMDTDAQNAA